MILAYLDCGKPLTWLY